ncbi:YtcA family lipoprotein [Bombella saccharophila]|uniref:Uncharacterized protein YtcA n=1 Tax=Bombella saccharophila TaxID=2967338 RepID=A0ABT3W490_9PROT|nr:YtcA family lipoprotein [Bombella saccharophila]MCX5613854.1 YtcA family lipoprotein [Bombella saccharophila]
MKLPKVASPCRDGIPWWVIFCLLGPSEGWAWVGAPSFPIVGAYFPAWLICLVIGAVGSVLLRTIFLALHVDGLLRFHLVTYLSLGTLFGLVGWLVLFGQ